jgi:N-methylhydantoinase A
MLSGQERSTYRVGADIGGTFTDIVMLSSTGSLYKRKQSSTPEDYSRGIAEGLAALMAEHDIAPEQVAEVVHATTVATNTVLEGKGARTALVTTRGFRDVLEIGRIRVPKLYDLNYRKAVPLALRRHRYEITERIAADGSVVVPLVLDELDRIADEIVAEGIEAVAVSFLNSHAFAGHEEQVRDRLTERLQSSIFVTAS